jgi:hypothetical protein
MPSPDPLSSAQRRLKKMQDSLALIVLCEKGRRYDYAYEEAFNFANESEKLTLLAREIPAYTWHPNARERMKAQVAESIPITIALTPEGWFKMIIPALLPRKEHGNQDYIRDNLYPSMQRFVRSRPPFYFGKSVIIFRHIYNHERPERLYRDHDNIELNAVVNVIALYLLRSDGPKWLEHYYCAARGETDSTEVYLVPQEDFDRFRVALKSGEIDPPESKITPL